jgi:hypothetical protein
VEEEETRTSPPSTLEENLSRNSGYDSVNGIGACPADGTADVEIERQGKPCPTFVRGMRFLPPYQEIPGQFQGSRDRVDQ